MTVIREETGTQRLVGYTVDVGQDDGASRCLLTVTDAHTNRHGVLHGGIAATLLDNAMGATGSLTVDETGRTPFLTISMNVNFIAPAHPGQHLTATGRVTGGGRATLFLSSELVADDCTLIATATGVYRKVGRKQPEGDR